MSILDWPEGERPRGKLLSVGADALSDAELLAIFLRTGVKGCSAVDLAAELLRHFGSLSDLFAATEAEFCQARGLGQAKYVQLQAVLEMARRYYQSDVTQRPVLSNSESAKRLLQSKMQDYEQEVFSCLFLNTQHQLLEYEEMFKGTINKAPVYPREIAKRALNHNAAAVILAHNHPSGLAEPSRSDEMITEDICKALALLDVNVLDHFIVGRSSVFSFAQHGLL